MSTKRGAPKEIISTKGAPSPKETALQSPTNRKRGEQLNSKGKEIVPTPIQSPTKKGHSKEIAFVAKGFDADFEMQTKRGVARTISSVDPLGEPLRTNLRNVDAKLDVVYTAVDSKGGTVPNDGTDMLFKYQSNHFAITETLREQPDAVMEKDQEASDDEESPAEFEARRTVMMQQLGVAVTDQQKENKVVLGTLHEKLRAMMAMLRLMEEGEDPMKTADMACMVIDNEELNTEGMTLNAQVGWMKSLILVKTQQCNTLIRIINFRTGDPTRGDKKAGMKAGANMKGMDYGGTGGVANLMEAGAKVVKLSQEVNALQREREFLYFKVYGVQAALLLEKPPAKITDDQLNKYRLEAEKELRELREDESRKAAMNKKKGKGGFADKGSPRSKGGKDTVSETPRVMTSRSELAGMVKALGSETPRDKQRRKELRQKLQGLEEMLMEMHDTETICEELEAGNVDKTIDAVTTLMCKNIETNAATASKKFAGGVGESNVIMKRVVSSHAEALIRLARMTMYAVSRIRTVSSLLIPFDFDQLLHQIKTEFGEVASEVKTISRELSCVRDIVDDLVARSYVDRSSEPTPRKQPAVPSSNVGVQCDPETTTKEIPPPIVSVVSSPTVVVRGKARDGEVQAVVEGIDGTAQATETYVVVSDATAPTGPSLTFVFTDIQSSTKLWEHIPDAMSRAAAMHRHCVREGIATFNGYEVKNEDAAFFVAFSNPYDALQFCLSVQERLLNLHYPDILEKYPDSTSEVDASGSIIWNGLRVRMGVHKGPATAVTDPIAQRMDYFGLTVTKCARIAAHARGGQILISQDVQHTVKERMKDLRKPIVQSLGPQSIRHDRKETMVLYSILPASMANRKFSAHNPESRLLPSQRGFLMSRWLLELDIRSREVMEQKASAEAPTKNPFLLMMGLESAEKVQEVLGKNLKTFLSNVQIEIRAILCRHEGYEVKFENWSLFAAFALPENAIQFAVEVQEFFLGYDYPPELLLLKEFERRPEEADGATRWRGFRFRFGIHGGEVDAEMDPSTYRMDYNGPNVNKTARMEAAARGGQILISHEIFASLEGEEEDRAPSACFESLGFRQIKGLTQPAKLHAVYGFNCKLRHDDLDAEDPPDTSSGNVQNTDRATKWGVESLRKKVGHNVENDFSVSAPQGEVVLVFTDIQGSPWLWENCDVAMYAAVKLHHDALRDGIHSFKGYEIKTEGDCFMVAFHDVVSAVRWAQEMQRVMLSLKYSKEFLREEIASEIYDDSGTLLWRGLRVRIGFHIGVPMCEVDGIAFRMQYSGPVVTSAAHITGCALGGEIVFCETDLVVVNENLEEMGNPLMYDLGPMDVPGIGPTRIYGLLPLELSKRKSLLETQRGGTTQNGVSPTHSPKAGDLSPPAFEYLPSPPLSPQAARPSLHDIYFERLTFVEEQEGGFDGGGGGADGAYALGVPRGIVNLVRAMYPLLRLLVRKVCGLKRFPPSLTDVASEAVNDLEYADSSSVGASHLSGVDDALETVLNDGKTMIDFMLWLTKDVQENSTTHKFMQTVITIPCQAETFAFKNHHTAIEQNFLLPKMLRPHDVPATTNMMLAEIQRLKQEIAEMAEGPPNAPPEPVDFATTTALTVFLPPRQSGGSVRRCSTPVHPSSGASSRRWCPLATLRNQYETVSPRTLEMQGTDASRKIDTLTGPFSVLRPGSRQASPHLPRNRSPPQKVVQAPPVRSFEPAPGTVLYYAQRRQLMKQQQVRKTMDPE